MPTPDLSPEERRAFRAFVREHHPDVGGDPETFSEGLAALKARRTPTGRSRTDPHLSFYRRRRGPARLVQLLNLWLAQRRRPSRVD